MEFWGFFFFKEKKLGQSAHRFTKGTNNSDFSAGADVLLPVSALAFVSYAYQAETFSHLSNPEK